MTSKTVNRQATRAVKNLSPRAMNAIKAFKGLTAKAIERAVRGYFLG